VASPVWNIRLLGKFKVSDPDGSEIVIPSRKARALFALLALHDGLAATRESLAAHLWPDKPRTLQQQNLRQAVKDLRDAFAPHQIVEAGRDTCRLAIEDYHCDATECLYSGRNAGDLMLLPEMPEVVFDTYRAELASLAPEGDLRDVVRSASTVLDWTLSTDPGRVLDLLFLYRELLPDMPLPQIESSLRRGLAESRADHPLLSWGKAQFATVLMWAGRTEEGIEAVKAVLDRVRPDVDPGTWLAAAHTASVLLTFRGRFKSAEKLLESTIAIATEHGYVDAVDRLRHAQALRLGYHGDLEEAIRVLERLQPTPLLLVHHAIYLTLASRPAEARAKLAQGVELAGENVDPRLRSQVQVTEGYIQIAEGRLGEARLLLLDLVPFCEKHGFALVQIHALEGLALAESDTFARAEFLRRSFEMRERHRYPLLPGDRRRLESVLDGA
jgi:hypothetical protein